MTAIRERVCAETGGVVVFLIGMRVNRPWRFWRWLPVARAMPRMLAELQRNPELGLLSARSWVSPPNVMVVQYWSDIAHLQAYAHAADRAHLPAWQRFNRALRSGGGEVGIWHETYVVGEGGSESVYVNMPPFGLGLAGSLHPATGARGTAAGRLAR